MVMLGNGLSAAKHHEDALSVREAELSLARRVGASARDMLVTQGNLAMTYEKLGRLDQALQMKRDVYSGRLQLDGVEQEETLRAANNYANLLVNLRRFGEAKLLLRKTMPVARRVIGKNHRLTLKMRWIYAEALYLPDGVTLDHLREAVTMLEETERTARRVLGGAHPFVSDVVRHLRYAREALGAREAPSI